uniref:Uncharacterized protein n=1 Tax=Vespula pensylvanica TaxID=30213 RepID=A0A834PB83_VESPE|nr:hypothetical protein H0235_003067 [Vespula pensylvanica]
MVVALTVATSSGPPSKGGVRCFSSSSRPTALNHGIAMHLEAKRRGRGASSELRIILNLSGGCRPRRGHHLDDTMTTTTTTTTKTTNTPCSA